MASYTPNYGLSMPDENDDYLDFRESYNENMEIIDENMGGGGGGDSVSWNQIQLSGDKIAEIDINGTTTDVNSPTYSMWLVDIVGERFLNHGQLGVGIFDSINVAQFTPWIEIIDGIPYCVWDDGN